MSIILQSVIPNNVTWIQTKGKGYPEAINEGCRYFAQLWLGSCLHGWQLRWVGSVGEKKLGGNSFLGSAGDNFVGLFVCFYLLDIEALWNSERHLLLWILLFFLLQNQFKCELSASCGELLFHLWSCGIQSAMLSLVSPEGSETCGWVCRKKLLNEMLTLSFLLCPGWTPAKVQ